MVERGDERRGMILGIVGVFIFSITLPATRIALVELKPITVGIGRSAVAAIIASLILIITRQPWPDRDKIGKLFFAGIGIVLGFPLFSALAMETVDASHGGVVVGLLPLATADCAVVVSGDRPSRKFWFIAALESMSVLVFSLELS